MPEVDLNFSLRARDVESTRLQVYALRVLYRKQGEITRRETQLTVLPADGAGVRP